MLTEPRALTLAISPQGTPYLAPAEADDLDPVVRARVAAAFARGAGHGLVYLALDVHDTALPPSFSYLRGLASALLSALAASVDLEEGEQSGLVAHACVLFERAPERPVLLASRA
ncbi:hypothetical protein EON77_10200 [bacterium]|nr:MAG: hypothetical protein EON77_10200 [bacterium]